MSRLTSLGFNTSYSPHCLRRDFAPAFAVSKLNSTVVDYTLEAENYYEFDIRVEGGIDVVSMKYHGGGHLGVGGDLGEVSSLLMAAVVTYSANAMGSRSETSIRAPETLCSFSITPTWTDCGTRGKTLVCS
jgi:hypothetical protein